MKKEKVTFTNMCMVYDGSGNVLVQDRLDKNWAGLTFPGGHVEYGESFVDSVIREVNEETGLTIKTHKICGTKDWQSKDGSRYVVLFYKTDEYSGELRSSEEGEMKWMSLEEMRQGKMAVDMEDMLKVFSDENINEFHYYKDNNGDWKYILQ